jgi:hypothetical protein
MYKFCKNIGHNWICTVTSLHPTIEEALEEARSLGETIEFNDFIDGDSFLTVKEYLEGR